MTLSHQRTNGIFTTLIACVAVYALFIIARDIGEVLQNARALFDQQGSFYPIAITFVTALVPFSIAVIGYLVYSNKRTYLIFFPVVHAVLLFSSYAIYGMIVLLLIWWFSKPEVKST